MKAEQKDNEISRQQKYFLCNECCFWIVQVLVVALGLAVMAKVIIGYQLSREVLESNQFKHGQQTVWLWSQGYIIDIKAENTNNCPQGYQELLTYTWPGSVDGCYCNSNQNGYSYDFVMEGKCSSELISLGCENVNQIAAQTMNMWKGSSLLCFKRAKSMNFYNSIMTAAPAGGTSPAMTTCAFNETYQVYTLPGVQCPITAFSSASVGSSQTTLNLGSSGAVLNFINRTNYPIAGFKLTQYKFCQFFNTSNISPNKKGKYVLQLSNLTDPCPNTDPRMVQIDTIDELNLFTNNSRVYDLISTLPAYPQPSVDYQFKLGYIPYPSWTYYCRSHGEYNLDQATDKLLFKAPKYSLEVAAAVTITCLLVLILIMRLFFIIRHIVNIRARVNYRALMLSDEEIAEQMPNLDIVKSFKSQCLIFTIELLLMLGALVSIVYAIAVLTQESVWIKKIIKYQCTEAYMENIFLHYEDYIDRIAFLLIEATFIWGALLIAQFALFVSRSYIGDLYTKTVEVPVQESSDHQEPINILEKQNRIEGLVPNDSSEIILNKEDNSQLKVYDMEYLMGNDIGGGQTKENFYGSLSLDREASINVTKKKKKKRTTGNKKKKIIADDEF